MHAHQEHSYRVAAVVVTYGSRMHFLKKTVEAILRDSHVTRLIIVDNASSDREGIQRFATQHGERVLVVHHEKNLGSAGGFSAGILRARGEAVDYVYLSDDDIVVSEDFVQAFQKAHKVIGDKQAVLCARRTSYWAGTDVHYAPEIKIRPRTYFNIFDPGIMFVFLKNLFSVHDVHLDHVPARFYPIIPSYGWAYAGVLLPIEAVRNSPLPDTALALYLDDIVYSWGVLDKGYRSFALMEPHLEDLELTHAGSHTSTGLFAQSVSTTKIYYETRNRVRVSLFYGHADRKLLRLKTSIWFLGVAYLGIMRHGLTVETKERMGLIWEALSAGFDCARPVPQGVAVRI